MMFKKVWDTIKMPFSLAKSTIYNALIALTGFRKLFVAVLVTVITTVFTAKGVIEGAQFVELLKIVIPAYFASNVGEYCFKNLIEHYSKQLREKE